MWSLIAADHVEVDIVSFGQLLVAVRLYRDDKHFIHCTFENCIVEYHGGEIVFELSNMRNCRHVFYGRARRTLQYLQGVGLMPHQPLDWGEFPERIQ